MEEQWEYSFFQTVSSLVRAAVHEKVFASRMAMYITIEEDVSTLECLAHHHFSGAVFGTLLHAWRDPLTIEIEATQRRPIISNQDAIRVEHGDDLKYKVVTQVLCHFVIRY